MRLQIWGLWCRVSGAGIRVQGRVRGAGFWVQEAFVGVRRNGKERHPPRDGIASCFSRIPQTSILSKGPYGRPAVGTYDSHGYPDRKLGDIPVARNAEQERPPTQHRVMHFENTPPAWGHAQDSSGIRFQKAVGGVRRKVGMEWTPTQHRVTLQSGPYRRHPVGASPRISSDILTERWVKYLSVLSAGRSWNDPPPSIASYSTPSCICSRQERLVIHCRTTSVSAAHATHCATCTPCRPLVRAFSGWIQTKPPTMLARTTLSHSNT